MRPLEFFSSCQTISKSIQRKKVRGRLSQLLHCLYLCKETKLEIRKIVKFGNEITPKKYEYAGLSGKLSCETAFVIFAILQTFNWCFAEKDFTLMKKLGRGLEREGARMDTKECLAGITLSPQTQKCVSDLIT